MSTPNPFLEEARYDMEHVRSNAEDAKLIYNQKAKVFNDQLARYERLKVVERDDRLALAHECERAGSTALASKT